MKKNAPIAGAYHWWGLINQALTDYRECIREKIKDAL